MMDRRSSVFLADHAHVKVKLIIRVIVCPVCLFVRLSLRPLQMYCG